MRSTGPVTSASVGSSYPLRGVVAAHAVVPDGRVDADGLVFPRDHVLMAIQAQFAWAGHQELLVGRAVRIMTRRALAFLDRRVDHRPMLRVVAGAALLVFRERRLEAMLARLIVLVAFQALVLGRGLMHNLAADDAGVAGIDCALRRDSGRLLQRWRPSRGSHGNLEPRRQYDAYARPLPISSMGATHITEYDYVYSRNLTENEPRQPSHPSE